MLVFTADFRQQLVPPNVELLVGDIRAATGENGVLDERELALPVDHAAHRTLHLAAESGLVAHGVEQSGGVLRAVSGCIQGARGSLLGGGR